MTKHNQWSMKDYLEKRTRSEQEEKMHKLLQKVSKGKLTVEDIQLFFDKTTRPLDFMRKYEEQIEFSNHREAKQFMDLLMQLWNQTPRTELHGKTPSETYKKVEELCELCETKLKCPHCEVELTKRESEITDEGDELTKLFCERCDKEFQDLQLNLFPEPDEETATIFKEIAANITDDTFDGVWLEAKKEIKDFSKRELAEEMFFAGVVNSLASFYAFGVPKEMLKVWAKMLGGEEEGMEETMKELERKMKALKND